MGCLFKGGIYLRASSTVYQDIQHCIEHEISDVVQEILLRSAAQ